MQHMPNTRSETMNATIEAPPSPSIEVNMRRALGIGMRRSPMPYRFTYGIGAYVVTGTFHRRRTFKHRGIMRFYGETDDGRRFTADVRLPQ